MKLYQKVGTRYVEVEESVVVGQAFEILSKRGMADIVAQTFSRLIKMADFNKEQNDGERV